MKLSREEVEHVALLARLDLKEEEKERFRAQLSSILEYAEMLNRLDTNNVDPTYHVLPLQNVSRPDKARESLLREEVLRNAPERVAGYFKVPRIL
ncbi:MAG: Asp-tRNA(Asn)/Glu-tRNA(Gln) amidotransferase subunit GatC [Bacillota bacterium]|nr:Asp-tRNA(Asn)/Glu-tRNA(Gln) amidotransferase subunit GatC [Bacillota bacterium]